MEVSSLPPVSFNIIRSPIPDVADLGGPVVFGFKGNEEKHEGTFELGEGTPEGKVDRAFGGIFTQSIEENAKVGQGRGLFVFARTQRERDEH